VATLTVTNGHKGGEIVCILDALDECEVSGRHQLIEAVSKFYAGIATTRPALKILLTSRSYLDIKAGLQELERKMPMIHLSGENEEEAGKISREIDMVVRSRIAGMDRLAKKERAVLEEELTRYRTVLTSGCISSSTRFRELFSSPRQKFGRSSQHPPDSR
jgi:hypothetical protein